MRKPKEQHEDAGDEAHYFDDLDIEDVADDDQDVSDREARNRKRPARQRVELRNEQQSLRRQLSDWDDYDDYSQDDFDTKL
jgi:hypothetical protein